MPHVLILDVEMTPDISGYAANDLFDKTVEKVREVIGDKSSIHIHHSVICIGTLIAHWNDDCWSSMR
jgi:hypothetical protein